jgi:hypothetical protein
MDEKVAIGPAGFPVQPGGVYRFTAWIAPSAFHTWPWDAPGDADIATSVRAAGWRDAALTMPWDPLPADWPAESGLPPDAFVVRGQGTWGGAGSVLPAAWPMTRGGAMHVALVWQHAQASAPGPAADPGADPTQPPEPPPPSGRHGPRPSPPPAGAFEPEPPRRRRGGGLLLGGVLAHSHSAAVHRRHMAA